MKNESPTVVLFTQRFVRNVDKVLRKWVIASVMSSELDKDRIPVEVGMGLLWLLVMQERSSCVNVSFSKWQEEPNAMQNSKHVNICSYYHCITCLIFNIEKQSNTTFFA